MGGVASAPAAPAPVAGSPAPVVVEDAIMWPPYLHGGGLRVEDYSDARRSYQRLIVTCPYHGPACTTSRSLGRACCRNYGKFEPLAFLGCWVLEGLHLPKERHSKWKPSLAQVKKWMDDHPHMCTI